MASEPDFDEAKLDALTDLDVQRIKAEEGYAFKPTKPAAIVLPPGEIRAKLGMTQTQFAAALRIPVATLRNWEQGRKLPDPAARSLLDAVARDPKAVLSAISGTGASTRGRTATRNRRAA